MSSNEFNSAASGSEELNSQEIPFADVLDSLIEEICVLDAQGKLLFCNASWMTAVEQSTDPGLLRTRVGQNYVDAVREALSSPVHEIAASARQVLVGLEAVLFQGRATYECEYPAAASLSRLFRCCCLISFFVFLNRVPLLL
jgi:hypothetical protein